MPMNTHQQYGLAVLRLGLAGVIFWFGFSQLLDAQSWIPWVPLWAENLSGLSDIQIVYLNGLLESAIAIALALNFYTRYTALILAVHMAGLVLEIGFNDIGMRDLAIGTAALSLALFEWEQ